MKEGAIYAFINFKQAAQFGHVGWGFRVANDRFYFGSVDHLWKHDWWDFVAWCRYMNVPPGADIDWWAQEGTKQEMLEAMKTGRCSSGKRHIFYHAYKEIAIEDCAPDKAVSLADDLKMGGWHISRHNCVQHAYLIFTSYASEQKLPDPFADPLNLIPKTWFGRLSADPCQL